MSYNPFDVNLRGNPNLLGGFPSQGGDEHRTRGLKGQERMWSSGEGTASPLPTSWALGSVVIYPSVIRGGAPGNLRCGAT